jgi:hypothetical protein
MTEEVRCTIGSATATPCPRPATEWVGRVEGEDAPDMCRLHERIVRLREAVCTIDSELGRLEEQDRRERGV